MVQGLTVEDFGGNQNIFHVFQCVRFLVHVWDDLIDKDKEVTDRDINQAFKIALVDLPANPVYRLVQQDLLPLWVTVISAYETANEFEAQGTAAGLEISHILRFEAVQILNYLMIAVLGYEQALPYLPKIWLGIVAEPLSGYLKEHQNAE